MKESGGREVSHKRSAKHNTSPSLASFTGAQSPI
jgi:hypothetical protein